MINIRHDYLRKPDVCSPHIFLSTQSLWFGNCPQRFCIRPGPQGMMYRGSRSVFGVLQTLQWAALRLHQALVCLHLHETLSSKVLTGFPAVYWKDSAVLLHCESPQTCSGFIKAVREVDSSNKRTQTSIIVFYLGYSYCT